MHVDETCVTAHTHTQTNNSKHENQSWYDESQYNKGKPKNHTSI